MFLASGNRRSGGKKKIEIKKKGRGKPVSGSIHLDGIEDVKSSSDMPGCCSSGQSAALSSSTGG